MLGVFVVLLTNKINAQSSDIYIRTNQMAFCKSDVKSAIILTNQNLKGENFKIFNSKGKIVFTGNIGSSHGLYGNFKNLYVIYFSELAKGGIYYIKIKKQKSFRFQINRFKYFELANKLLEFFKVQRCGFTNPELHGVCHKSDATSIIKNGKEYFRKLDVTGGWHDAGDYVKFLNTSAFSTYMLLFAYDFDPITFSFDVDKNNVPDVLDEAKIGLDYLLRSNYRNRLLVTEVQDFRDHSVGWRMPENDSLEFSRPAYLSIGKNLVGIYAAALALGAKIWKEKFHYTSFADKCLKTAEVFFRKINTFPDIAKSKTGMYVDQKPWGKMALGAVELFRITRNKKYLKQAELFADSAKSDFWWSWGNINSLAHFRISEFNKKYQSYILQNLTAFSETSKKKSFREGSEYSWGTNQTLLGIALQAILWERLTGDNQFDSLAVFQRDFTLGANPWGISFFYRTGTNYTTDFHHQIAHFQKMLPGGFAAGPVKKKFLDSYKINFDKSDRLKKYQTENAYYRDDRNDFITNEPTITAAATAIFVMGYYAQKK